MRTLKPILSILLLSVFILSCEKEGPAGPVGPAGEQGVAGPKGAAGATADLKNVDLKDFNAVAAALGIRD